MKKQTESNRSIEQAEIERATFKNLFMLVKKGQLIEIIKVIRRRILNSLKVLKRVSRKIWGIIYDYPPIKYWREQRILNKILLDVFDYSPINQAANAHLSIALIIREGKTAPKSSAFIRLISPLTDESIRDKVSFRIFNENTTELGDSFEFCIVQRTAFDSVDIANELVTNLSQSGTKLIIDTDDAFGAISKDHPEYDTHSSRMEAKNILLKHASQIWVSTAELKKSMEPSLQKKAFVIPNGLDPRLWRTKESKETKGKSGKLRMVYMGTATHDADLKVILPALEKLNDEHPGSFSLDLVGVTDNIPDQPRVNRVYLKSSLYPEFVKWFVAKKRFDVGLSPLQDSDFNKSKSDIKCLDYLAAGILPVVSSAEAYRSRDLDNCVIRVKSREDWFTALESLLTRELSNAEIYKKIKNGQKYVWTKRSSKNSAALIYKQLSRAAKIR